MTRLLASLTQHLLRLACRLVPPRRREWIDALSAEAESIDSHWRRLAWSIGSLSLALRYRAFAGVSSFWEEIVFDRTTSFCVLTFAVLLSLFLIVPAFHDTASVAPASVRVALGGSELSESELRNLAAAGEKNHDASAMAFAAMRLSDHRAAMRLGKQAIAIDPSLSWIEYFIIREAWRMNARATTFGPETLEVIAADPTNALGYLLRAEWIRRTDTDPPEQRSWEQDSHWGLAMQQAFSAAKYDDYLFRRLRLDQRVVRAHHMSPFAVVWSSFSGFPDIFDGLTYGNRLIDSGNREQLATVLHFASLLRNGQTETSKNIARELQGRSLAALARESQLPSIAWRPVFNPGAEEYSLFLTADATVIQVSLLIAALALLMCLLLVSTALLRGRSARPSRPLRYAAIAGTLACAISLLAYIPFAQAYSSYLNATSVGRALESIRPFLAFSSLPSGLWSLFALPSGRVYLWYSLLVACLVTLAVILGHRLYPHRPQSHPA